MAPPENQTPLTPAQQELALEWLPAALREARFWASRHPDLATEYESAAGLAVCKAAQAWNPRGCSFEVRLRRVLRRARAEVHFRRAPMGYRALGRQGRNGPRTQEVLDHHALVHPRFSSDRDMAASVADADVTTLLELLPRPWRDVLARTLEGRSDQEIAQALGRKRYGVKLLRLAAYQIARGVVPAKYRSRPGPTAQAVRDAAAACAAWARQRGLL